MKRILLPSLVAGVSVLLFACTDQAPMAPDLAPDAQVLSLQALEEVSGIEFTGRYLIMGVGDRLPARLATQVENAGGEIVHLIPQIGVAVAVPRDADFATRAARIPGVGAVAPDMVLQWTDPELGRERLEVTADAPGMGAQAIGDNAFFRSFQWAPDAIRAPDAWAAGYTGAGVRVAILDGAIWDRHLDLAPNLDAAASRSFTPGADWNVDTGTFWHGTHVAGIVAASGNVGTAGIAPEATLVGVKVLHGGGGAFEWLMDGVVYAATPVEAGGAGAHVINMSLGASVDLSAWSENKALRDAIRDLSMGLDRAMRYAYRQGTTVIASAGNGATNHDVARELWKIPAQSQHVLAVSSTGPHGWALGATDFERPAYYSDFGRSLVDVAAPGGTLGLWVVDGVDQVCQVSGTFTTIVNFCEVFDLVLSTTRGSGGSVASYGWAQGTSMAAPAAAGVAALIIQANGGHMNPHAVAAALRVSATDLGQPGFDEFYGHGWVNAARAVGLP